MVCVQDGKEINLKERLSDIYVQSVGNTICTLEAGQATNIQR